MPHDTLLLVWWFVTLCCWWCGVGVRSSNSSSKRSIQMIHSLWQRQGKFTWKISFSKAWHPGGRVGKVALPARESQIIWLVSWRLAAFDVPARRLTSSKPLNSSALILDLLVECPDCCKLLLNAVSTDWRFSTARLWLSNASPTCTNFQTSAGSKTTPQTNL